MKTVNKFMSFGVCCFLLIFSNSATAHGDLHERIEKVSKEIKAKPDSAYLYLKRGVLYYQHEEYKKSLKDLKEAAFRQYEDIELDIHFAKVNLAMNDYDEAIFYTNKILSDDPIHVNAWKLKGKIHFESGEYDQAADAFMQVIQHASESFPSNYLDASISYELSDTPGSSKQAILIVEKAMEDLGPIITLQDRLIELYIKDNQIQKAIDLQSKVINQSNRKETALYERSQMYLLLDQVANALKDLYAAQSAIQNLPLRFQNHLAMRELKQKIELQIKELNEQ